MRFRYDPESGALYVRIREGDIEETLDLGPGAYLDIDRDGNVMGAEFLSLEEFTEIVEAYGGSLELPERVEDPEAFRLNLA
jgi:uncharacterized protein YuzE